MKKEEEEEKRISVACVMLVTRRVRLGITIQRSSSLRLPPTLVKHPPRGNMSPRSTRLPRTTHRPSLTSLELVPAPGFAYSKTPSMSSAGWPV